MRFVADVHVHSRYSRATSRDLNPENLHRWASLKGVQVVGTGDFTHPEWVVELEEKLQSAEEGLFELKASFRDPVDGSLPASCRHPVRFILSVEISSIYKKGERTRKVHNLVLLPDFAAVHELNRRLGAIGNITSDGRPILGLDSRNLLEICLEVCPEVLFIPAHIWTPHFAVLGASSGFESLEECYGDLLPHIPAVETGLSSDPPMNSRLSALDGFAVVSNSDAHSARKLAREATCFDTELSYPAILSALRDRDPARFRGTLEFYPEEGKYHYDGHRKCGVRWTPRDTLEAEGRCPECGRQLTVGVLHRVEKLADRAEGRAPIDRPFEYLIPLEEIIGSVLGVGPATKTVQRVYEPLLERLGPELTVLRHSPIEEIARAANPVVAEGVRRMRSGQVHIAPGFDGEFGTIQVFTSEERAQLEGQSRLFEMPESPARPAREELAEAADEAVEAAAVVQEMAADPAKVEGLLEAASPSTQATGRPETDGLDDDQRRAVEAEGGPIVVVAGPGSGKTRTLTHRIAHLIREGGAKAGTIAAVTFTNRAAGEVRDRLQQLLPGEGGADEVMVGTFHRLSLELMRSCSDLAPRTVLDAYETRGILAAVMGEEGLDLSPAATQDEISRLKATGALPGDVEDIDLQAAYRAYQGRLAAYGACDYDDILLSFLRLLERSPEVLAAVRTRVEHLLVDEFQDVNAVQYQLVKLMVGGSGLYVIGDPDQAIYGFRGADPAYFDELHREFPQARTFRLRRNYRSRAVIVAAAESLMGRGQPHPGLEPPTFELPFRDDLSPAAAASPPRVRLVTAPGETAEGIAVVREIARLVGGADMVQTDSHSGSPDQAVYGFGDVAVLFRTGRQAEVLETCFLTEGLPYRLVGQKGFLERRSVRDVVAFFRFAAEPGRGLRILEALRTKAFHPGKTALANIGTRLAHAAGSVDVEPLLEGLSKGAVEKIRCLWGASARFRKLAAEDTPGSVLGRWREEFGDGEDESFDRLMTVADRVATMAELLDTLLLGQDADIEQSRNGSMPATDAVKLMTMHAAKGLEFPVVFICGVEDGLIPLRREDKPCDLDEERRLFYVALTRAQEEVVLLRAARRTRYGKRIRPEVSPFVADIPGALLSLEEAGRPHRERSAQLSLF
ncbi:UvrD-helicase domain-containing protein [Candidatus Latescibacterota bacterium]